MPEIACVRRGAGCVSLTRNVPFVPRESSDWAERVGGWMTLYNKCAKEHRAFQVRWMI